MQTSCTHEDRVLLERLVEDLRAHRPEALEQLLAMFGRELQAIAYLVLGSRADAEEVVMDTMVIAWQKAATIREPNALRGWLMRIATRQAISRKRRIGTALLVAGETERASSAGTPSIDRLALLEALTRLPREMRAAVVLHYYADLTTPDVAAALGKSVNTVKAQLREGLRRLRVELADAAPTAAALLESTDG
ncbi:MAG: RNA polymerase sigma factor [Chloroflexota bacterium]|nr:RNA polymerase sigma factor [Chloroflexota bacterium]